MTAIIVDDEPDGIRTLNKLIELHCPEVQVKGRFSTVVSAREALPIILPDVVFLDIRMPDNDGFELLSSLDVHQFQVIFVTAHNEYLLQALQFSAADYLMKPVDEDRLIEAVQRVSTRVMRDKVCYRTEALLYNINNASSPAEMRLCVPTQKGFTILKLEDIIYCEAQRSYTLFRLLNNKSILISRPLFDYDKILAGTVFLRIHKSFLINLYHVKEYLRGEGGTVIMSDGMEIEVSRRKKEQFMLKVKEIFKY
jgi:two-component system, LytTR family, response regulator